MRILFVDPPCDMSIGDVARGYRRALERQGHETRDYNLQARFSYHMRAIPKEHGQNKELISRHVSENIVVEALYHNADVAIIVSGLNVHPIAMWLLGKVNIPVAVIFTESPYDDAEQANWVDFTDKGSDPTIHVFTNDAYSARTRGWHFLPPAADPAIHHPVEPQSDEFMCDVFMVGTGWAERQQFLEAVDWTGIDLRLYGIWPELKVGSPLYEFYRPLVISNEHVREMYCSAKINLNLHRGSKVAETPGPRVFEVAACGGFQLSDPRRGITELFGDSIPSFSTPQELGEKVRYYLANEAERKLCAARALDVACNEDFDKRAAELVDALTAQPVQT